MTLCNRSGPSGYLLNINPTIRLGIIPGHIEQIKELASHDFALYLVLLFKGKGI
jgi:hypothetical protein